MYNLVVYIPESHLDTVKQALFNKGAGRFHNYDCCAWQVAGTGQYRALENSKPFIGLQNHFETVPEYRVEMICQDEFLKDVLTELKRVHPYEEPAYHAIRITTINDL